MQVSHRGPIRLIVVEREELYRDLLRIALSNGSGLEVVGVFADGDSTLKAAAELKPQVAILDLELTKPNGVQLAFKLRRILPELGVVLLSSGRDIEVLSAIPDNLLFGWSYLVNRSVHTMTTLGRAIQVTAARLLDLQGSESNVDASWRGRADLAEKLTDRQLDILELVSQGMSNAAVAQLLQLKEKTIENQLANIYEKLGIGRERSGFHPRVQAVLCFLQASGR